MSSQRGRDRRPDQQYPSIYDLHRDRNRDRTRSPAPHANDRLRARDESSVVSSAYRKSSSSPRSPRCRSSSDDTSVSEERMAPTRPHGMVKQQHAAPYGRDTGVPPRGPRAEKEHQGSNYNASIRGVNGPAIGPRAVLPHQRGYNSPIQSANGPPTGPCTGFPRQAHPPTSGANGPPTGPRAALPHQAPYNSSIPDIYGPPVGPRAALPQDPRSINTILDGHPTTAYGTNGAHAAHGSHTSNGVNGVDGTHSTHGANFPARKGPHEKILMSDSTGRTNGHNFQRSQPQVGPRGSQDGYNRALNAGRGGEFNGGRNNGRDYRGGFGGNNTHAVTVEGVKLPKTVPVPTNGNKIELPTRKIENTSPGNSKVTVFTNHFEVQSLPCIDIFQYDIRVTGDSKSSDGPLENSEVKQCSPAMVRKVMESPSIKEKLGCRFIFDGVSIGWSTDKLPFPVDPYRYRLELPGSRPGRTFGCNVDISYTGKFSTDPFIKWLLNDGGRIPSLDDAANFSKEDQIEICLKFLNALLRADPSKRFMTTGHGNKSTAYFQPGSTTVKRLASTGDVLEAWRGFYQTVSVRFGKLTINVDTTTAAFIQPGIRFIDAISTLAKIHVGQVEEEYHKNRYTLETIMRKFVGVGFKTRHIKEGPKKDVVRRVMRMTRYGASQDTFQMRRFYANPVTGEESMKLETISVAEYYRQQYNIILNYPSLPMVESKKGEKFPLELCFVADCERWKETLQGRETADFIKYATAAPNIRKNQVEESLKHLKWHEQRELKEFGVSINPALMQLPAIVLKPVVPIYNTGTDRNGQIIQGRWNLAGKTFCKAQTITQWGTIYFPDAPYNRKDDNDIIRFTRKCYMEFRKYGIMMPPGQSLFRIGDLQGDLYKMVLELLVKIQTQTKARPNLLVFLFDSRKSDLYAGLKKICDTQFGIASQCMLTELAIKAEGDKRIGQYLGNIAMKINVKLGGINAIINDPVLNGMRTLVIGCDATYPNSSQLRLTPPPPAFVALAANYDLHCAQFSAVTDAQDPLDQKVISFKGMAQELINRYTEKVACNPERIIYFRDGLSEGGYGPQLKVELDELKKLTNAPITVILCIKRHHTRFFPGPGDRGDERGNVIAGTVVENGSGKDIFLVSHIALIGTARPTRYVAVYDDNKLSASQFQELCNNLCYGYGRATMAVSMVPPVYYARLACERARLHLKNNVSDRLDQPPGSSSLAQVHKNIQYSMWWQ